MVVEGVAVIHEVIEVTKQLLRRRKERADLKALRELFPVSGTIVGAEPESLTPTWVKIVAFLGLVIVAVGVAGEWKYEVKFEAATDAIQTFDSKQAGDAARFAQKAHDELVAVKKDAGEIQQRLDIAAAQLQQIEELVRIQGPRVKLLERNRDKFIAALKPFAGQRVTVVKCSYTLQAEPEQLEQYLLNVLGVSAASKPNAGWIAESPGYTTWAKCNTGASSAGGNLVVVSSTAAETVKAAAVALNDAFNRIDISTIQAEADASPQGLQFWRVLGEDSPWVLAIKDPTAVIVLIGTNPMFDLAGWHKRHK
ncbi:MAG TPA: hypothetical protein VEI54_04170 [Candidatus Limnocylindrales bacterium]|nr:hypothetical protein [Candidatus Limnocylindrales bacterium]